MEAMTKEQAWAEVKRLGQMKLAYRLANGWTTQESLAHLGAINQKIDALLDIACPRQRGAIASRDIQ
jgi:hypothetical protein